MNQSVKVKGTIRAIRFACTVIFWAVLAFTALPILFSAIVMVTGIRSGVADVIVRCTLIYVVQFLYVSLAFLVSASALLKLLLSVECGEPFDKANRNRMRIIGFSFIFGSFFRPVALILYALVSGIRQNMDIFIGDNYIYQSGFFRQLIPDVSMLIGGLLVVVLSFVFSYGFKLQREHDQTV